ncbi:MAG: sensor histidine kinase [Armatimonadota bacterium]
MTTETPAPDQRTRWLARLLPAGIGARLVLLTTLTLLPLLLLLGWVYYQRYETRRAQAQQTELEVAQGVAVLFDAFVTDVRREELVVGQAILTFAPDSARAGQLLSVTEAQYVAVTNINWVSPEGRILASSDPGGIGAEIGDRPYFRAIREGEAWAISELLPVGRVSGRPSFVIAQGIRDAAGRLRGVVVAGLDPTRLGEITLTQRRPAGAAYAIFDREGTLVYRSPEAPFTWEKRTVWRETDTLLRETLRTGEPAAGVTGLAVVGGNWISARAPIAQTGWVAGAGRRVDVALAPIRQALALDALLALLAAALAFGLAALIGHTISHPLRRLQNDVRHFGEGNLAHRAPVAGPTEVAQVAAGFNQMAAEIEDLQDTLEARVRQRTAELEASNRELEAFSYSVAHDLRSPLRSVDGFSKFLLERYADRLDDRAQDYLRRMRAAAQRMGQLIDDLLSMARLGRVAMRREQIDFSGMAAEIVEELRRRDPERRVTVEIAPGLVANADRALLRAALGHLLDNAWKFTARQEEARITVDMAKREGECTYVIRDNGVGFDMAYADKLFQPFQRLHTEAEFPGTGIGLALVQRIIQRHGGRIWADSAVGQGAAFYFTLGEES